MNTAERSLLLFMKVLDLSLNPEDFHVTINDTQKIIPKDGMDPYQKLRNELNKMIKISLSRLLPNDLKREIVVEIFTLMNDKFELYLNH